MTTQFDVVLVPFPFDDLSGRKLRPAVCLTPVIGVHHHVVLGFVSSVIPQQLEPTDLLIDPSRAGFPATGLKVASVVRLHRLLTLSASVVARKLGALDADLQAQVREKLRKLFDV
jgi:mRNA interferase MazF